MAAGRGFAPPDGAFDRSANPPRTRASVVGLVSAALAFSLLTITYVA